MDYFILILLVTGIIAIFGLFAAFFWVGGIFLPMFYKGGPYVPSSMKKTLAMIRLANLHAQDHVIDLGSGDGRLLFEAIKAGAGSGEGYEIHPGLVWWSRFYLHQKKLNSKIKIHRKSFWNADVSKATVILLYQLPDSMDRLGEKLKKELPSGARIISHAFPITNWEPIKTEDKIYVYKKP